MRPPPTRIGNGGRYARRNAGLPLPRPALLGTARPPGTDHRAHLRVRRCGGVLEIAPDYCKRGTGSLAFNRARLDASRSPQPARSEEHTSELQSQSNLVCRLLLEKKNKTQ